MAGVAPGFDVFRLCRGLRFLGSFMVLVVLAVVLLNYYTIVVLHWGPIVLDGGLPGAGGAAIILVFHILLVMLLWSYFTCVLSDPGSVPPNYQPRQENAAAESGTGEALVTQRPRWCRKCNQWKPERAHHCSVCGKCVLKMDHHCIWVVNCVGACNYKAFLLFLFYTTLETTVSAIAIGPFFVEFFQEASGSKASVDELIFTFLAFILDVAFALSVFGFICMHVSMVAKNVTTIESFEEEERPNRSIRWRYDIGRRKNFEQVFGTNRYFWFIPLYTKEDMLHHGNVLCGLEYPTSPDAVDMVEGDCNC
mmetsp:Transcript_6447/g.23958  ORF Transcript_6447/g.23958 Transcript_6447/m.23958 type:complete len:308 (-) Transcript_6447:1067-1990(-)